jgi:hypothetical protein
MGPGSHDFHFITCAVTAGARFSATAQQILVPIS